jgi:hypothetical protein
VDFAKNLTFGARRLRRFNIRWPKAFERGSGVNAALQFGGSMREDPVGRNLSQAEFC